MKYMNKQQIISELEKFNFPKNEYAIFGSGPLAIRELRESNDIDVIVTKKLFEKLKLENPKNISLTKNGDEKVLIRDIEIFNSWRDIKHNVDLLIKTSELIEGYPFVKLEYVIEWKKNRGKEKDHKDIDLINKFLNKN